jgi:hypothetical protein
MCGRGLVGLVCGLAMFMSRRPGTAVGRTQVCLIRERFLASPYMRKSRRRTTALGTAELREQR